MGGLRALKGFPDPLTNVGNLIKKPWGLYWGSLYESYNFWVMGPGFLNQLPTLRRTWLDLTAKWGNMLVPFVSD